jgi:hypothetical protein
MLSLMWYQERKYSDASLWVPGTEGSPAWWQHSSVLPEQWHGECQTFSAPSKGPASTQGLDLLTDLQTQNILPILTISSTDCLAL